MRAYPKDGPGRCAQGQAKSSLEGRQAMQLKLAGSPLIFLRRRRRRSTRNGIMMLLREPVLEMRSKGSTRQAAVCLGLLYPQPKKRNCRGRDLRRLLVVLGLWMPDMVPPHLEPGHRPPSLTVHLSPPHRRIQYHTMPSMDPISLSEIQVLPKYPINKQWTVTSISVQLA